MSRTSLLGGEVRRRSMFGSRSRVENACLGVATGIAVLAWWGLGGKGGLLLGAAVLLTTFGLVWRPLGHTRSLGARLVEELRWQHRRRSGATKFLPPASAYAEVSSSGNRAAPRSPVRAQAVPAAVGSMRCLTYRASDGRGSLAVLHHRNPGTTSYLSAVMEVDGVQAGLQEEADYDVAAIRWSELLSSAAKQTSLVRGVQLLTRVVPMDLAPHERFVREALQREPELHPPVGHDVLLQDSYQDLLLSTQQRSEHHRNFVVLRIPLTGAFFNAASAYGTGDDAWCAVVFDQMVRMARAARAARFGNVQGLGEQRLAALIRSLQDPDFPIDEHADITLANCWQASRAHRRHVEINSKWCTRVAYVPSDGVPHEPVHSRWMGPLLTGVSPSVVRTVSVMLDLMPAARAREAAVKDVTVDRGGALQVVSDGMVSDGSAEVQMTASQQRLSDLRPGSRHHGVGWGMYLSVTADRPDAVLRDSERIEEAAGESGINRLEWLDTSHDLAQVTTWPMWRGLEVS